MKKQGNALSTEKTVDVDINEFFSLYYVWSEEDEDCYAYYLSAEDARAAFERSQSLNKTYGEAKFVNGRLEKGNVLGSTL